MARWSHTAILGHKQDMFNISRHQSDCNPNKQKREKHIEADHLTTV